MDFDHEELDGLMYNHFLVRWNNPNTEKYRGPLWVVINKTVFGEDIILDSVIVKDQLDDSKLAGFEMILTNDFIRIGESRIGTVDPGVSRMFDVYFFSETPSAGIDTQSISEPVAKVGNANISWLFIGFVILSIACLLLTMVNKIFVLPFIVSLLLTMIAGLLSNL